VWFNKLDTIISDENLAKSFIKSFILYKKIQLTSSRIETDCSPLNIENAYKYCKQVDLPLELQEYLFIWILRCDIDNISYPPPLNGCIRIFIQVFLLFAYKFKWKDYYIGSHIPTTNLPDYIHTIGFPCNKYSVTTEDFNEVYRKFLEKPIVSI